MYGRVLDVQRNLAKNHLHISVIHLYLSYMYVGISVYVFVCAFALCQFAIIIKLRNNVNKLHSVACIYHFTRIQELLTAHTQHTHTRIHTNKQWRTSACKNNPMYSQQTFAGLLLWQM